MFCTRLANGGLFPTGDPIVPFVIHVSPRFECLNKRTHPHTHTPYTWHLWGTWLSSLLWPNYRISLVGYHCSIEFPCGVPLFYCCKYPTTYGVRIHTHIHMRMHMCMDVLISSSMYIVHVHVSIRGPCLQALFLNGSLCSISHILYSFLLPIVTLLWLLINSDTVEIKWILNLECPFSTRKRKIKPTITENENLHGICIFKNHLTLSNHFGNLECRWLIIFSLCVLCIHQDTCTCS